MEHMSYAKSISWIDDCRIPFVDDGDKWIIDRDKEVIVSNPQHSGREDIKWKRKGLDNSNTQGRFPANILVCDDMLNDGIITKQTKWNKIHNDSVGGTFGGGNMNPNNSYGDKGTNSRYYDIDKWFNNLLESCG